MKYYSPSPSDCYLNVSKCDPFLCMYEAIVWLFLVSFSTVDIYVDTIFFTKSVLSQNHQGLQELYELSVSIKISKKSKKGSLC